MSARQKHKPAPVRPKLGCVMLEPEQAWALWPDLEPHIAKACALSGGRFTPEWIVQNLTGDFEHQVWALLSANEIRGVLVTTVQIYPATGLTAVNLHLLAGDNVMGALRSGREALAAFKKARGAHVIEWMGRDGFGRLWPGAKRLASAWEVR
jgi:hypothetical protein